MKATSVFAPQTDRSISEVDPQPPLEAVQTGRLRTVMDGQEPPYANDSYMSGQLHAALADRNQLLRHRWAWADHRELRQCA